MGEVLLTPAYQLNLDESVARFIERTEQKIALDSKDRPSAHLNERIGDLEIQIQALASHLISEVLDGVLDNFNQQEGGELQADDLIRARKVASRYARRTLNRYISQLPNEKPGNPEEYLRAGLEEKLSPIIYRQLFGNSSVYQKSLSYDEQSTAPSLAEEVIPIMPLLKAYGIDLERSAESEIKSLIENRIGIYGCSDFDLDLKEKLEHLLVNGEQLSLDDFLGLLDSGDQRLLPEQAFTSIERMLRPFDAIMLERALSNMLHAAAEHLRDANFGFSAPGAFKDENYRSFRDLSHFNEDHTVPYVADSYEQRGEKGFFPVWAADMKAALNLRVHWERQLPPPREIQSAEHFSELLDQNPFYRDGVLLYLANIPLSYRAFVELLQHDGDKTITNPGAIIGDSIELKFKSDLSDVFGPPTSDSYRPRDGEWNNLQVRNLMLQKGGKLTLAHACEAFASLSGSNPERLISGLVEINQRVLMQAA